MSRARRDPGSSAGTPVPSMWPVATWQLCRNFVLSQLALRAPDVRNRPLIVGVQGPQGSGKSTLVHRLASELSSGGYRLRVAVMSIDDLYLPASDLDALHAQQPHNKLLSGRGLPGTHDVELGERILANLRGETVEPTSPEDPYAQSAEMGRFPVYDKSANNGRGDRSESVNLLPRPRELDVFLLEGWCLGFAPLGAEAIAAKYADAQDAEKMGVHGPHRYLLDHNLTQLQAVDNHVADYARRWSTQMDSMIQLWPVQGVRAAWEQGDLGQATHAAWTHVFEWRLEAERKMRHATGSGMDDDEVRAFVARYMPAYELWAATGKLAPLAPGVQLNPLVIHPDDRHEHPSLEEKDEVARRNEQSVMPHAPPERILRIDLDARRSVQHFTLF